MAEVDGVEFEDDKLYVVELEGTVKVGYSLPGAHLKQLWADLEDPSFREEDFRAALEDPGMVVGVGVLTREVRLQGSENPDTDA